MTKRCCTCGKIKNITEFTKNKSCKDGLRYVCRSCDKQWNIDHKEIQKKYSNTHKEKIADRAKRYRENNKESIALKEKQYRDNNKQIILVNAKEYRLNHTVERAIWKKHYRERNKEERNKKQRARFKNDQEYATICRLRSATRRFINNKTNPKSIKTEILLGASWQAVIIYINSLGYNSKIHDLDHIVPLAVFDCTNIVHQRIMFNYLNLQPIPPTHNYIKQSKLLPNWKETIISITSELNIDSLPIIKYIESQNIKILYEEQLA